MSCVGSIGTGEGRVERCKMDGKFRVKTSGRTGRVETERDLQTSSIKGRERTLLGRVRRWETGNITMLSNVCPYKIE